MKTMTAEEKRALRGALYEAGVENRTAEANGAADAPAARARMLAVLDEAEKVFTADEIAEIADAVQAARLK